MCLEGLLWGASPSHLELSSGGDLRRHAFYLCQHYRIMHIEAALLVRERERFLASIVKTLAVASSSLKEQADAALPQRQVSGAFSHVYAGCLSYENILPTELQLR